MKIGVKIMPRKEVLDVQGRAVAKTLNAHNGEVLHCQVGRYVELDFDMDEIHSLEQAKKMANLVLCNPLVETFELEVLK